MACTLLLSTALKMFISIKNSMERREATGEGKVPLRLDCMLRMVWELRRIGGSKRGLKLLLAQILRLESGWMALGICGALRRPLWCVGVCSLREIDREVDEFQNFGG